MRKRPLSLFYRRTLLNVNNNDINQLCSSEVSCKILLTDIRIAANYFQFFINSRAISVRSIKWS